MSLRTVVPIHEWLVLRFFELLFSGKVPIILPSTVLALLGIAF
jgi:hypothetical protein